MDKQEKLYLNQITRSGMAGRKKDTRINKTILTLVFLFFSLSIILLSSFQKTEKEQKIDQYGGWKIAEYGILKDKTPADLSFAKTDGQPGIMAMHGAVLNEDGIAVNGIGTMNEEVKETGRITLLEGEWPENEREAAIEMHSFSQLNCSYEIGQTITCRVLAASGGVDTPLELVEVSAGQDRKTGKETYSFANLETGDAVEGYSVVEKEYVVTGIIRDYSSRWALGENSQAAGFVVGAASADMPEIERHYFYRSPYSIKALNESVSGNAQLEDTLGKTIVLNEGIEKSNAFHSLLTAVILGLIFVITVYAVFQTFSVQMKKRTFHICLLKGIGAANGQVAYMTVKEAVYLLCSALPAGTAAGILCSLAVAKVIFPLMHQAMFLYCGIFRFLSGLLLGVLAVLAGMSVPVWRAAKIPLVGNFAMEKGGEGKTYQKRRKKIRKQSFWYVTLRHHQANRGNFIFTIGMVLFSGILLSSTVFLAYFQFKEYFYYDSLSADYNVCEIKQRTDLSLAELNAVYGVEETVGMNGGWVSIEFDGWKESPILSERIRNMEKEMRQAEEGGYVAECPFDELPNTVFLSTYESSREFYESLFAMSENAGQCDLDQFMAGNEVLVYIPDYRYDNEAEIEKMKHLISMPGMEYKKDSMVMTFANSPYLKKKYERDNALQAGDSVTITGEDGKSTAVLAGGIIRHFTDSRRKVGKAYGMIGSAALADRLGFTEYRPYSDIDIITDRNAAFDTTDKKMSVLLRGTYWLNFRLEREDRLQGACSSCVLVGLTGMAGLLVCIFIQYNSVRAKLLQEQKRIGILRSMGVTKRQMRLAYGMEGLLYAAMAAASSASTFAACFVLNGSSLSGTASESVDFAPNSWDAFYKGYLTLQGYWEEVMDGYPLRLHAILLCILIVTLIWIQVHPLRKALSGSVAENIREMEE